MSNNFAIEAVPAKLKDWLEMQDFKFTRLGRECSDGVRVAQLIKKLWPKLIDIHNYPSQNSTSLKLANWQVLNRKALRKLGLHQKTATLEQLAKGEASAAENLLLGIMQVKCRQDYKENIETETEQEKAWMENDELLMVNVNRKIGDNDNVVQVPEKMILYSIYEEKSQENEHKIAQITSAQQKITHLESLLTVKGTRVEELESQIAKLSIRANTQDENTANKISMLKKSESGANNAIRSPRKLDPATKMSNLLLRRASATQPHNNSMMSVVNRDATRDDRAWPLN